MKTLFLLHFAAIAIGFILGLLVFLANPKRRTNRFFFMLASLLTTWMTCQAIGLTLSDTAIVGFIRTCMALAVFIPLMVDWLLASISHPDRRWRQIVLESPYWLLFSVAIAILSATHLFVAGASRTGNQLIPEPVYTVYFPIYAVYFVTSLGLLLLRFARALRDSTGAPRTELQFVMLGSATGITVGVVINIILPLITGNSRYALLTPLSVICLYVAIGYGIATRRIMDVAAIIRRITSYAFLIIFLAIVYAAVWLTLNGLLTYLDLPRTMLPHFISSLVVAFSLTPSRGWMKRVTNHLFINFTAFDANQVVQSADALFRSVDSMDRLLRDFATLVTSTIGAESAVIVLRQQHQYAQRYPATDGEQVVIPLADPLPVTLATLEEPVVTDILRRLRLTPTVASACRSVEERGFTAAVGLFSQEGLEGMLLLTPRLSGRIYGAPEQQILQLLCNQLATAISTLRLYTQLQDSKIYNEILVDSLVSGVIAVGTDKTLTVFNREAQRITRLRAPDVLGQPLNRLPAILDTLLAATLDEGVELVNQDHPLATPEGGEAIPLRVSSSIIYGHTGKRLGAFLVINDLTTIRQLELQVRRTDRLASLGTLAAGMAHEIKNPLVSIKTFTQLLPERFDDADFRETFSSLVGGEVKRIDSIVNQLLRFSRPAKPVLVPVSLHALLSDTLKLLHQQMRSKNIRLVSDLGAARDLINADGDQLSQSFINFILNAIESMGPDGTLTVTTTLPALQTPQGAWWSTHPERPMVLVTIQDTGGGIPPDILPHIFDPFFTTKDQGTGLGLSVAHGIITEHNGLIDVRSEVGKGTQFTLALPLHQEETPA